MAPRVHLFFLPLLLFATAVVQGQCVVAVQSEGQPLPGAIVLDNGAPLGLTGNSGEFRIPASSDGGTVDLQVRALGHLTLDTLVRCGGQNKVKVTLKPEAILIGGATVVGSLSPLRMKDSPIRTQVLAGSSLRRIPADDATEAIDFTNGVRETLGCGVCGTNSLQINGLEGVYTLVLLDGVPLLGGLASAYALDGIPLGMIQQVEVIQGPASARFGSQALGGVINIVLAPIRPGHGRASATLDTHGRLLVSANSAFGSDESPWQIGADVQRFTTRIDDNGDGYTDAPTLERGVLTVRKQHQGNQRRWRTTLRTLAEERFGGALDFREADRGLETRYGERIDLLRIEGVAGSSPLDGQGWRFQGGAAYHRQQSTYGTTNFNAEEWTTNVDAFHSGWSVGERGRFTSGASLLWDRYTDETPADSDMNVWVPAAFAEYSGTSSEERPRWTWIHGLRIERPSDQGLIVAPRINLKWAPAANLDFRFNAGRGYRRVHLFTEEHAALDGSRSVIQPAGGLDPESSWNALLAADWQTGGTRASTTVSARAFSTVFTDRIYADYDSLPNTILYRNIDGTGWSRGIGLDLQWMHSNGWQVLAGATRQRSVIVEGESAPWTDAGRAQARPLEFAPDWTANLSVGHQGAQWGIDLQSQAVGPMKLPEYPGQSNQSTPYGLLHLTASHTLHLDPTKRSHDRHLTISLGVKNLTNTSQPTPLLGGEDPFGEAFEASRVYGPIEGRRFLLRLTRDF